MCYNEARSRVITADSDQVEHNKNLKGCDKILRCVICTENGRLYSSGVLGLFHCAEDFQTPVPSVEIASGLAESIHQSQNRCIKYCINWNSRPFGTK
ncbi:Rab3 Gtpase-Activating Protein Catalytic Subunit [Manis pentadactyla]|nr:Rab3 Gtpase-Activating Protein Catalytic Subunit [Manis pentadactyla]